MILFTLLGLGGGGVPLHKLSLRVVLSPTHHFRMVACCLSFNGLQTVLTASVHSQVQRPINLYMRWLA